MINFVEDFLEGTSETMVVPSKKGQFLQSIEYFKTAKAGGENAANSITKAESKR